MRDADLFVFADGWTSPSECLTVLVRESVSSAEQLFALYYDKLSFPGYFGHNWNALYDCLCDLSWLTERTICVVHEGLPGETEQDSAVYLDVLRDAVRHWKQYPQHRVPGYAEHDLIVVFPSALESTVERLLPVHP